MATYTTAIKINAKIDVVNSISSAGGTVILYTAPSNGYAQVYLQIANGGSGGNAAVYIDGTSVIGGTAPANQQLTIQVGPGAVISATSSSGTGATTFVSVLGVEYINS